LTASIFHFMIFDLMLSSSNLSVLKSCMEAPPAIALHRRPRRCLFWQRSCLPKQKIMEAHCNTGVPTVASPPFLLRGIGRIGPKPGLDSCSKICKIRQGTTPRHHGQKKCCDLSGLPFSPLGLGS
jgi:hypothetical protein